MTQSAMDTQISTKPGFIAALDQSGGSTPGALRHYGIADSAYGDEAAMFGLMHQMRVRIMTSPAFSGEKIIAAILFERTMDGQVGEVPVPAYLWDQRGIVPFLKVDQGLEAEQDGVRLMKPIAGLDPLLARATKLGIFGTKMRSVIGAASPEGIAAIAAQQFDVAEQIARHGLMPILEPEILVTAPDKAAAEDLLHDALVRGLDRLPAGGRVMLKLTLPEAADRYRRLVDDPRVARVVALSGGYSRDEACRRLLENHGVIASFSRALLDDLRCDMDDQRFDAALGQAIDQIYAASADKN